MNTAKLTVPDMSCGHCEMTVKNTLGPIAGIDEVIVDLPTKTVRVTYDPAQVSVDQMGAALAEEFYPVGAVQELAIG